MEISRHGSEQSLEHYLVRNAEVVDTQTDKKCLSGIKVELFSMRKCQNQPRGKYLARSYMQVCKLWDQSIEARKVLLPNKD